MTPGAPQTAQERKDYVNTVRSGVLRDAIQHPTTLLPLAVGILSGIWSLSFGWTESTFLWTAIPAVLGASSFVCHYFMRFDTLAQRQMKRLQAKELDRRREASGQLERECRQAGFSEGAKEVKELEHAFLQLWQFIRAKDAQQKSSQAGKFLTLAEDSFREGLGMVASALDTFKLLQTLDHGRLQRELVGWMADMKKYQRDPERHMAQIEALKTRIRSHQSRIQVYRAKLEQVHQCLAQSEVIEAALETTLLEVSEFLQQDQFTARAETATRLEQAVQAARNVEERLRSGLATAAPEEEDLYLEAGKTSKTSESTPE
jgi:hypothetical protein